MAVSNGRTRTEDIKPHKTGCPASLGFYSCPSIPLVGLIFVGQWIGSLAIAAVTVVLPITFLFHR
jgi:Na+-driven multidrug efflux pump